MSVQAAISRVMKIRKEASHRDLVVQVRSNRANCTRIRRLLVVFPPNFDIITVARDLLPCCVLVILSDAPGMACDTVGEPCCAVRRKCYGITFSLFFPVFCATYPTEYTGHFVLPCGNHYDMAISSLSLVSRSIDTAVGITAHLFVPYPGAPPAGVLSFAWILYPRSLPTHWARGRRCRTCCGCTERSTRVRRVSPFFISTHMNTRNM